MPVNPRSTLFRALKIKVGIRTTDTKVREIAAGLATEVAAISLLSSVSMFDPRLPNLLEPFVITRAATHSVEVMRHDRMICIGHCKKADRLVPGVA